MNDGLVEVLGKLLDDRLKPIEDKLERVEITQKEIGMNSQIDQFREEVHSMLTDFLQEILNELKWVTTRYFRV